MGHADDPTTSAWGDYDTRILRAAVLERRMVRKKPSRSASPWHCRDSVAKPHPSLLYSEIRRSATERAELPYV
jgi:hypothetical protein